MESYNLDRDWDKIKKGAASVENVYENYKKQLDEVFNRYHTKNAICYLKEDGGRLMLTYGQLKETVIQIGRILADVPLCPSDRIAVLSPHTPFAALVIVALSYLGYTAVPLDVSLPAEEIERLLTHIEASAIFMDSKSYGIFGQAAEKIPVLEIGHDFVCSLRSPGKAARKDTADGNRDIAVIIFSSGTTGSMKGIEVTYMAILYAFECLVHYTNLDDKVTYLDVLPLNHIVGYSVLISCILKGCEVGFLENATPQGLSRGFSEYKPTNFIMIPKVYEVIQEKILALGMDSLNIFEMCTGLEETFGISMEPYLHAGMTVGEIEGIVRRDGSGSNQADANTKRKLPFVSEKKRAVISDEELRAHCEDVKKYYMDLQFNEKLVRKNENYYRAMV